MAHMLDANFSPTAVLASNDLAAIGMMRAIRRAGCSVPQDMSVVGFDDIRLAEFTEPPLTTVHLSRRELAQQAFAALLHDREGLFKAPAAGKLQTHLFIRESTCRANANPAKT